MKFLILFTFLFGMFAFGKTEEVKLTLPENTFTELEKFSKKNLNAKTDFEEVKKTISVLLVLDDEDPSRTAVQMLSESYNRHKSLYNRAIKSLETKKNKKQLGEIKQILANFSKDGNG